MRRLSEADVGGLVASLDGEAGDKDGVLKKYRFATKSVGWRVDMG